MRRELLCAKRLLVAVIVLAMLITSTIDILSYADSEERISVINGTFAESGHIKSFETKNPVYNIHVNRGTLFNDLGLPETLRVILSVTEEEKSNFVQVLPETENDGDYVFFQYGYVQESNADEKFEKGEPILYTILYADGTEAYRIYGRVGEEEPRFFACDEKGRITGQVANIKVTWDEHQYDSEKCDTVQTLEPNWSDKLSYDGDKVVAQITVQSDSNTVETGTVKTQSASDIAIQASGSTAYEQAMEAMRTNTPTSGNIASTDPYGKDIPGTWVDYINTIWQYQTNTNPFTFTENTGVATNWKWNGKAASESGDPSSNPNAKPIAVTNQITLGSIKGTQTTYDVYSAAQMRYVLEQVSTAAGKKATYASETIINIKRDLDFNGQNYNWSPTKYFWKLTINGNDHVFYNICSYRADTSTDTGITGAFMEYGSPYASGTTPSSVASNWQKYEFKDIVFKSFMSVTFRLSGGGIWGMTNAGRGNQLSKQGETSLSNISIYDSLFYNGSRAYQRDNGSSGYCSTFGAFSGGQYSNGSFNTSFEKCRVIGCKVYGKNHISGFLSRAYWGAELKNCFVTDTVLCGTGGHSGGVLSCQTGRSRCTECFSNISMYSSRQAGGFSGTVSGIFDKCYSTGKLEGYAELGGFMQIDGTVESKHISYQITNCYSTMLVGMRSAAKQMGGFIDVTSSITKMENCYAAGEVGDNKTDARTKKSGNNNTVSGGFTRAVRSDITFKNCYYDKQTTAMREWVTAEKNEERGDSVDGITGVLTTTTTKAGTGLTANDEEIKNAQSGFKGFTDNSKWSFTDEGHYPQLYSMRWPGKSWGDSEIIALVKANSLASTSTVFLDTWDTGYDWSNKGVRSEDKVSYSRTKAEAFTKSKKESYSDHVGYVYTYDTVREIISDFDTTKSATFISPINEGQGANTQKQEVAGDVVTQKGAINIVNRKGQIKAPGMEWFDIQKTGFQEGQQKKSSRPIRLVSLMNVEAGSDKELSMNSLYNHTTDARFTIMNEITDDMVIGMHDDLIWSQSTEQKYPSSNKYYEAVTTKTSVSASQNAWVYTEIWLVGEKKDGDSKFTTYDKPKSVRVTGEGTNTTERTATEKQWLGQLPLGTGLKSGMKFQITYYWMLSDGRYCTDSKYVTLAPGKYNLTESVYNRNGTENDTALYLGTVKEQPNSTDKNYLIDKKTTKQLSQILNQQGGTHIIAAWEKNLKEDLDPVRIELQFSNGGIKMSDVAILENKRDIIKTGDKITINATYYGYDEKNEADAPGGAYDRIVLSYQPINVKLTYTVQETKIGDRTIQYLLFDHDATIRDNSFSQAADTVAKVSEPSMTGYEKLNLFMEGIDFDIDVKLIVPNRCNLRIQKLDGTENEKLLSGVKFNLFKSTSPNTALSTLINNGLYATDVYLDANRTNALTDAGVTTDDDGIIQLYGLNENTYYYLAEIESLDGYTPLNHLKRIHIDPDTNTVIIQALKLDGTAEGNPIIWHYSNDTTIPSGEEKMDNNNFVSVQLLNYPGIDMPTTGGRGTVFLLIFSFLSIALAIALIFYRKTVHQNAK